MQSPTDHTTALADALGIQPAAPLARTIFVVVEKSWSYNDEVYFLEEGYLIHNAFTSKPAADTECAARNATAFKAESSANDPDMWDTGDVPEIYEVQEVTLTEGM